MKRYLFSITILGLGIVIAKTQFKAPSAALSESHPLKEAQSPSRLVPSEESQAPDPAQEDRSFEELVRESESLSESQVESEIARLDSQIRDEDFVSRANRQTLSEFERARFQTILRKVNALRVIRIQRLLNS